MAISPAIAGSGYNFYCAVARNQGLARNIIHRGSRTFNTGYIQSLLEPVYAGWALGTGVPIDVTGTFIYNDNTGGAGALSEASITNRGPNSVYIGINNNNIGISSGILLVSGETYKPQNVTINKIWAIAGVGVTILTGFGENKINPHTV